MTGSVLGPLVSGLIGLVGVVVGAVVTAAVQARPARRTREAAEAVAARDAVRELLATSDITRGLYETVWLLDEGGRRSPPREAYDRAVAAWADYQRARFSVRMAAPVAIYTCSTELTALLERETNAIDAVYRREAGAVPLTQDQIDEIAAQVAVLHTRLLAETHRALPSPPWAQTSPTRARA